MENKTFNPEALRARLEEMKNSANPMVKRMAEIIEKSMAKSNVLNK